MCGAVATGEEGTQKSEHFEEGLETYDISISYIGFFIWKFVRVAEPRFGRAHPGADFCLYDSDSHLHDAGSLVIAGLIVPAGKAVIRPFSARFPA
ncbi:hypothetical protein AD954_10315 [Acetobacter cerevisiae]|uniref:Uncharacterized protein n=1 Tax=Acetobacter cerevisiae TaxID=178900 RepID=A0A149V9G6_9PROT|nr:hypothetical protein AD954_10315 [Acetobacter cerevisiae]